MPARPGRWPSTSWPSCREAYLAAGRARLAGTAGPGWSYEMSGLTLTVSGLDDGAYSARWLDPQTGAWLEQTRAASSDGSLKLPIPPFTRDLAVKIIPDGP